MFFPILKYKIDRFRSVEKSNQTHSFGRHVDGQQLQSMLKLTANNCSFFTRKEAKYGQSIILQKQNILGGIC